MLENFMIQKSMTRKPFLEFSHTEAKKPWHISLCCCMSTKQSKLDGVWEVYQNSSNNLVTEWYKFSQEILLSLYTVICFLKAKHMACWLDTIQDFLIKLGIKPHLHILKIIIFSLNHVIVRPTKIMNNPLKVFKICTFKVIFQHQKSTESFWFFFCEEYLTRRSTFINEIFWKLWFLKYFVF